MITKEQAMKLSHGAEIHCGDCKRTVGPRGGVKESIVRCRVTGVCKTWVRQPEEFRLPIKHGLYDGGAIEAWNAPKFHLPEDCPIIPENERIIRGLVRDTKAAIAREESEESK